AASKTGDRYEGWPLVKQGNERAYAAGEGPKTKVTAKSPGTNPTTKPASPASDEEKAERAAAGKLELARSLLKDGKTDRAKQRLQEIVQQYPKTKAADEARKELDKLK